MLSSAIFITMAAYFVYYFALINKAFYKLKLHSYKILDNIFTRLIYF